MRPSLRKGFGSGLTSGVITTLGMMVGLTFSTNSPIYVIAGIAVIAVADTLSDAIAMHVSEEASTKESEKNIWMATFATFISKFLVVLVFIVPVLLFNLYTSLVVSVIFGLILIVIISALLAKTEKRPALKIISEHLLIAVTVIIATGLIGRYIESIKNNYV